MAESLSELYFRLGLDTSDFESGLVNAENTLSQNLKELNAQSNLVNLKANFEIVGLDEAKRETDGLKIRQEALNKQLEIQSDRVKIMSAAYQDMAETQGEASDAARNLELELAHERAIMAQLQRQSQTLGEEQKVAFGVNWEMLGLMEPSARIIEYVAHGREALTLFGRAIPVPQLQIASMALLGLTAAITGTMDATEELAENNATQILAQNTESASVDFSQAMEQMQYSASIADKSLEESFYSMSKNSQQASEALEEQTSTFSEYASDFFRIGYILSKDVNDFEEAMQVVNGHSHYMQTELGKNLVIATGIFQTFSALKETAISFVRPIVEEFKKLRFQSDALNLSLSRTQEFKSLIDLSGADLNDVRDYVRGVQDAVIKGDSEDPEVIALEKYGVVIQDAQGRLLSFNQTLENLYQGFLKARDAGEEEAYIIMTNGQAVQDVLPFFNNLAKAKEDYNKIKWSTSDFAALEQTNRDLTMLDTQIGEFYNSLKTLGLPLADFFAQNNFEWFKWLTELIEENRETILEWEFVFIEAMKRVQEKADELFDGIMGKTEKTESWLTRLSKVLATLVTGNQIYLHLDTESMVKEQDAVEQVFKKLDEDHTLSDLWKLSEGTESTLVRIGKLIATYVTGNPLYSMLDTDSIVKEMDAWTQVEDKFLKSRGLYKEPKKESSIFDDAKMALNEYLEENEKAREETEKLNKEIEAGLSYSYNRIKKYKEELATIEIDLKFGDNEYEKSLAKLDVWYDEAMKDAKYYEAEQEVINELRAAKVEQIERTHQAKLAEIRDNAERSRRTYLENTLADIEKEKAARISAGMEAAEAIQLAAEESAAAIQELETAFTEKVNDFRNNALQRQYDAIDRDRDSWVKRGISPERADAFADEQKTKALQDLEESFSKRINEIRNSELENQLARIDEEKQAWIDKGIEETRAEELASAQRQKVLDEFEKKQREGAKKIQGHWERVGKSISEQFSDAFSVLKNQLEAFRAYLKGGTEGLYKYELKQLKKQGITEKDLKAMTTESLEDFQQAQEDIKEKLLPNFHPEEEWVYKQPDFSQLKKSVAGLDEGMKGATESVKNFDESLKRAIQIPAQFQPQFQGELPPENSKKISRPYRLAGVAEGEGGKYWLFQRDELQDKYGKKIADADAQIFDSSEFENAFEALKVLNKDIPKELFQPYRFAGFAEGEGGKHWLFQRDELLDQFGNKISNLDAQMFDSSEFTNALEALKTLNEGVPNYTPPPEGTDLEAELVRKLHEEAGKLGGGFISIRNGFEQVTATLNDRLAPLTERLSEVTNELSSRMTSTSDSQRQPVSLSTTVSINEAHAWDYEHIQELAERVGNVITPRIVKAIGGDSNSY